MKKLLLGFAIVASLSATAIGQESTETGQNQRAAPPLQLTLSQRNTIASSNPVALLAAEDLNNQQLSDATKTGTNRRADDLFIVPGRVTPEGIQLFLVQGQETEVGYNLERNAFIPVTTREQATRVATGTYQPTDDATGKKLKKRKANKQGTGAEVFLDVKENRKKLKVQETDEQTLAE